MWITRIHLQKKYQTNVTVILNISIPDTEGMPNVSRGVTELLEVCVEDTKAIGVEEDFLSASVESDIMT